MKNDNFQYILSLYSRVDDYLAGESSSNLDFLEAIVSFCILFEKILKIKLHEMNPILVFDHLQLKDDDALFAIIDKSEKSIITLKISDIISRYKHFFKHDFSEEKLQISIDIYNARNHILHSYKHDGNILLDKDNLTKKMGTLWEDLATIFVEIFGKESIQTSAPKYKYTEQELEKVLEEEVAKKISSDDVISTETLATDYLQESVILDTVATGESIGLGLSYAISKKCPRCGSYGFSKQLKNNPVLESAYISTSRIINNISNLYICNKCNLELTEKEYEIAKKIKNTE